MFSKQSVIRLAIVLVIVTALLSVAGTIIITNITRLSEEQVVVSAQEYSSLQRFSRLEDVYNRIMSYYYEKPEEEALVTGAIKGMVQGLKDPYSRYYTPEEFTNNQRDAEGLYSGIGILVSMDKDTTHLVIIKVYPGTPAQEAELQKGDVILSVDGNDLNGMEMSEIVAMIKGEDSTKVTLQLQRGEEVFEKTMERRQVTVDRAEWRMLSDDIAYLQISEFSGNCLENVEKALDEITEKKARALILDLRDNPGGMMDIVVPVADRLLPEGLIVYTEDVNGNKREEKSDGKALGLPMVVLVNGNTASASEILAGAIQDYEVGTLIGTVTYGKGIVQSIIPYNEDGAALQITTSRYYTPKGRNIHGEGIKPDIIVEMPENLVKNPQTITDENDPQLKRALEVLKAKLRE